MAASPQSRNDGWAVAFLISGKPVPAMLDMARFAQSAGLKTLMLILERGHDDLTIDKALINYDCMTINVPYKTVDFRRFTSIPTTYFALKRVIVNGLAPDGIIITSSYDLLLFARVMAVGRRYTLRHQVRDLHSLQLSRSPLSLLFSKIEQFLLKRIDRVMVSSSEFYNKYYRRIYAGRTVLLENIPARRIWADFKKEMKRDGCFRIGFIGIIRYKDSLNQLISAVGALRSEGFDIKVVFAGGGYVGDVVRHTRDNDAYEFLGPYEYSRDIKRLYRNIDLIYCLYDSNDLNCQLAMPTKFYESIISKIPIIVAKNTFVEREVFRLGIGTAVLSGDIQGLVDVLRSALASEGWYSSALKALNGCEANAYFDSYEKALRDSILSGA